ncbi:MAG: C-GCAxxG-C-C family protein [Clostridiales Family XIII bacterium]|jgi:hypothetical protein|nr:C-GCAxxG-C-C family protein [Clostridiales Family XIII bacterium]
MDVQERIFAQKVKGQCCSEIIAAMCLADLGREGADECDLVKAMAAFCEGMGEGQLCGTLAAATAMLFVGAEDKAQAARELLPEMMNWFYDRFGAYTCADLIAGEEMRKLSLCPGMIEETYLKLREMLEDAGAL